MNTQPEDNTQPAAIKLAEWFETSPNTRDKKGAAELRRLHEVNQVLVEALTHLAEVADKMHHSCLTNALYHAKSALAKAQGEKS